MATRPNIVLVMTDQQRADLCAREGYPLDTTPALDRLAREGTWFDHAYTTSPTCLPARVSLLTGRFPSATRARTNHNEGDTTYDVDLVDVLKANDYDVALVGKNHSHLTADRLDLWVHYGHVGGLENAERTEREARFDQWLAGLGYYGSLEPAPFTVDEQVPARMVRDSIDWIDARRRTAGDRPFFLWLSFPEPHNPYQAPLPYFDMFSPDKLPPVRAGLDALDAKGYKFRRNHQMAVESFEHWDRDLPRMRSNYHGMLRLIDGQLARFVDYLDACDMRGDTLVVMVSDHGDYAGEYGMMRKGSETAECLMRIPMLWHGPGIVANRNPHGAHVSLADVMPTLCEMIGAAIPDGVQGRSLWPLLTGGDYPAGEFDSVYAEQGFGGLHYAEADEGREDLANPHNDGVQPGWFYDCLNSRTQSGTMRMVRKGDWKLAYDMMGRGQLYHVAKDPAELRNRFNDAAFAPVQMDLLKSLLAWSLRMEDPLPRPRRRYIAKTDPHNWYAPHRDEP